jgi:glucan phosphorylase
MFPFENLFIMAVKAESRRLRKKQFPRLPRVRVMAARAHPGRYRGMDVLLGHEIILVVAIETEIRRVLSQHSPVRVRTVSIMTGKAHPIFHRGMDILPGKCSLVMAIETEIGRICEQQFLLLSTVRIMT